MAFQYQFANYSFQTAERGAAAQEAMDRMSADGWRIHTAAMNYVEVSVLWEKEDASAKGPRRAKPLL